MAESVLSEFLREAGNEPDILLPNDPSPASRWAAAQHCRHALALLQTST